MVSSLSVNSGSRIGRFSCGLTVVACVSLLVSGCAGVVPMEAADDANSPDCAAVTVRLPNTVDGQLKRETNAQATAAWGEPASILLRCGIEPMGPTTLPCVNVNGIDWIRDESQAPLYRFEAYGRVPTVEVIVDSEAKPPVSGTNALVDLANAVSYLPQERQCVGEADAYTLPQ